MAAQGADPTKSTTTAATAASDSKPRFALVIGNADYREITTLPNVTNDLEDMCRALGTLRFRTTCLPNLPTREAFTQAVRRYVDGLPQGAISVIHYSGHAIQAGGENYLIPTGVNAADKRGWLSQFVPLSELFQVAERARNDFQLIVLDACRDDPDAAAPATSPPKAPAVPAEPVVAAARSGRDNLRSMLASVRSGGRFAGYGIAAIRDAPGNTLVLFATGAGSQAFDGDGERNGPLTKHLLIQMQRADLRIDDAVKNIIQNVGDDTERRYFRRQSPALYGTFAGEFCFNGCPVVVTAEQVEAERRQAAELERQKAAEAERKRKEAEEQRRRSTAIVPAL